MLTSEYVSCTGVYKALAAALNSSAECVLVVGGPGCGKSTFARQFLVERGFALADVGDICEREAMTKRVRGFCETGGVDAMVAPLAARRAIWLDDNLQMGTVALACAAPLGVPVVATSSAKALSKFPTFRKRCTIVKMNYPSKTKCLQFLRGKYPETDSLELERIAEGVNGSIPRAVNAVEQVGVSDYIEDRRKMDMSVYEIAESVVKIARGFEEVKAMTSSEPVMLSIILQEMSAREAALKACTDILALGDHDVAEVSCFSGFLYANRKSKAKFPRCYSLASSKAAVHRKTDEMCRRHALVPWETAFLYAKKR